MPDSERRGIKRKKLQTSPQSPREFEGFPRTSLRLQGMRNYQLLQDECETAESERVPLPPDDDLSDEEATSSASPTPAISTNPTASVPVSVPASDDQDQSLVSAGGQPGRNACDLCQRMLGESVVICHVCTRRFHAVKSCLGVEDETIEVLMRENNGAIKYVCCTCRNEDPGSVEDSVGNNKAIPQILSIIGRLVNNVSQLSESASAPKSHIPADISPGLQHTPSMNGNSVMSHIRELHEREKRKSSIVLRGFGDRNAEGTRALFREICNFLGVGEIEINNLVRINPTIYRAKISLDEDRLRLLSSTYKLKNSTEYRNIFIQKDLTFQQRNEVIRKRRQRSFAYGGARNQLADRNRAPMRGGLDYSWSPSQGEGDINQQELNRVERLNESRRNEYPPLPSPRRTRRGRGRRRGNAANAGGGHEVMEREDRGHIGQVQANEDRRHESVGQVVMGEGQGDWGRVRAAVRQGGIGQGSMGVGQEGMGGGLGGMGGGQGVMGEGQRGMGEEQGGSGRGQGGRGGGRGDRGRGVRGGRGRGDRGGRGSGDRGRRSVGQQGRGGGWADARPQMPNPFAARHASHRLN